MAKPGAESPTDPDAVFDDYREAFSVVLVHEIPEQAGIAARCVEIPKDPPIPKGAVSVVRAFRPR